MKWILGSVVIAVMLTISRFYGAIEQYLQTFNMQTVVALAILLGLVAITAKIVVASYRKETEKVRHFRQAMVRSGLQQDIKQLKKPRNPARSLRRLYFRSTTYYV
jgi:hypothetical protein